MSILRRRLDDFILRGDNCFLKTGSAEVDVTQVVNFILHSEQERVTEILAGMNVKPLNHEVLPEADRISREQIFIAGQMNMLLRIRDATSNSPRLIADE